ncbi:hypothetical protein MHB50_20750 [Siminovitchia sp. FSL H7-0308]|uniref:Tetratricopeptide (TPR) repeat protein n=1 Tax=Siminovitchia thermophila TaxID=1245522 RepID=A0ABS2R7N4_9BACI|nr:hypothetical protein [Siminovitchia thermophila]MBM7714586.1 tetratricopeptide (TPR) repeat protein [Siminovitchia thermophila]
MSTIAFEEVGQVINDWYKVIKQQDVSKAAIMRKEMENMLPSMEKNQNVLLYFNLIDSRYKLMTEDYKKSGELLDKVQAKALEESTENIIQYYFHLFSGMYKFHQKRYINAIIYYKMAEEQLKKIPDEIEKAEFHYQLAIAYYQIEQNIFSITHAKTAYAIFKAHDSYKEKMVKCEMILGANKLDLLLHEQTKKHYEKARSIAKENGFRYTESLALFNFGICFERQKCSASCELF